jgi:surface polysaccharide O-acyltransferase-like enzyme
MGRIVWIDLVRSCAILLALTSHGMSQFLGGVEAYADTVIALKFITRTATPMFFILFGVMLELVYLRMARELGNYEVVATRLVARGILCYVLYLAISLTAALSGGFGAFYLLKTALLIEGGGYGLILAGYAALFAIIFLTLPLAVRLGSQLFGALAMVGWAAKLALDAIDVGSIPGVQHLIGHSNGYGPAILLCFTFVAFGAAIGEALQRKRSWAASGAVLAIAVVVLAYDIAVSGLRASLFDVVFHYRWQNHPAYFAFGILTTSFVCIFARWLDGTESRWRTRASILGSETLFLYVIGNIILNLMPITEGNPVGLAYLVLFLLFMGLITLNKIILLRITNAATFGFTSRAAAIYSYGAGSIAAWLVRQQTIFLRRIGTVGAILTGRATQQI